MRKHKSFLKIILLTAGVLWIMLLPQLWFGAGFGGDEIDGASAWLWAIIGGFALYRLNKYINMI